MLLMVDKDRGFKAYYDKVINSNVGSSQSFTAGKESHKYVRLWIKSKGNRQIQYDQSSTNYITNNPILVYVIPYDSYGTLTTDNIASLAYYCRLYYKDP